MVVCAPSNWGLAICATSCPKRAHHRHQADGVSKRLEVRVFERARAGDDQRRGHNVTRSVTPMCSDEHCRCECDVDFSLDCASEQQCPAIDENDTGGCQ